jgi:hypothetical protein
VAATKNPILLAYKYSHVPYALAIGVKQHESIATIGARVLRATVHSTLQQQGNLVTQADYLVANQSQQFLRVQLPPRAELWRVVVEGKTVKPAHDEEGQLIVPLPRSDTNFPVSFAFARKERELGLFGGLGLQTPRPDLFIDEMTWTVDLPDEYGYHRIRTNMNLPGEGVGEASAQLRLTRSFIGPMDEPAGVRFNYIKKTGVRGIDTFAALFGIAFCVLLLRVTGGPGRFERGLTLGIGLGAVAWVVFLHASPWALLLPLLVTGIAAYLRAPVTGLET